VNDLSRRLAPPSGSILDQLLFGPRRGRVPPGGFLCGLRSDERVSGLTRIWRYRMSAIESSVLVFGLGRRRALRLSLRLVDSTPIQQSLVAKADFLVWAAIDQDSGFGLEIAASPRDAYLITESDLANGRP
jgi:hypothetical protein